MVIVIAAVAVPASSRAQDRFGITLGVGMIGGADSAANSRFAVPVYNVAIQGVFKRYLIVEGELAHWSHSLRTNHGPHDIVGPNGFLGTVTGATIVDAHRVWNVGVNLLVRSTGRVRVFGGGGAGLSIDDTEYSQQSFGCSPSLDPRSCTRFVSARMRGPVPQFRALGGVEVPLTPSLGIFAAARSEASAWEDRRNLVSGVGGLRFSR
jgi:hypothetical protein